jgi:hypothetical protein
LPVPNQASSLATNITSGSHAFITHSQNKVGGTSDIAEHHPSPFVVGAGNENT